jgi:hypothetical protein
MCGHQPMHGSQDPCAGAPYYSAPSRTRLFVNLRQLAPHRSEIPPFPRLIVNGGWRRERLAFMQVWFEEAQPLIKHRRQTASAQ